jgi:hypothetical protein
MENLLDSRMAIMALQSQCDVGLVDVHDSLAK